MDIKKIQKKNKDKFFFANSDKTKCFKKNEIIYEVNDKISQLYIILGGEVLSRKTQQNKKNFRTHKKGSVLGLMDTILNRNYSQKMIAKSKVSLALIDKKEVESVLHSNPFQFSLIKSLAIDVDKERPDTWS